MEKNKKINSFFDHFPPKVAEYCFQLWHDYPFDFIVSKSRHSKLGDYRFSPQKGHQITVNRNLNSYAFLVTYLHEVAHLLTYLTYKNKVLPHGEEWKNSFRTIFEPLLEEDLLPVDLIQVLKSYLVNPSATSTGHGPLVDVLKTYDASNSSITLHALPENQIFLLKNLELIKGKLRRTRYFCKEANTGKLYLVAKNAQVTPLESNEL
ncbi:MAG: SprT-like domain-containing protein [Cytophagales bacterium]|nr:SprT-like domain-containing protein [Cytophagales bacterium]